MGDLPTDENPSQTQASGDDLAWVAKQARAHGAVARAVSTGKLKRGPCEVCGARSGVDAHHDDYDKPLEVRWLCRLHHRERHLQGGRKPHLGTVSVRSLRFTVPDEPVYVVRLEGGVREVIGLWVPIRLVDE